MPFPVDYLIAPDGRIASRFFLPDYQTRVAASRILLSQSGAAANADAITVDGGELTATIGLSANRAAAGQEIGVVADFSLAPGWHAYGQSAPENYRPLEIKFEDDIAEDDIVMDQSFEFPAPQMRNFEALGETLPVHEGRFRALGRILMRSRTKPGEYRLKGTVSFQLCDDATCNVPEQRSFELPFTVLAHASAAPRQDALKP